MTTNLVRKSVNALLGATSAMVLVGLATGCASEQKKQASAPPPPTAAQLAVTQAASDRTAYVQQTQTRIDQLTKFSGDLRTKAATAQKPQNKKLENTADDMDSLLGDAKKSLNEVTTSAPENWIDYKRDVEKSMDRAENEYSNSIRLLQ